MMKTTLRGLMLMITTLKYSLKEYSKTEKEKLPES